MDHSITCPTCQTEIEVTEILRKQLAEEVQRELEAGLRDERDALAKARQLIRQEQDEVQALKADFQTKLDQELQKQRGKLVQDAEAKAREELSLELEDQKEHLEELQKQLAQRKQDELELRKRERALLQQQEDLQLEVERQLNDEREKVRQATLEQFAEEHRFKDAEKEKQIDGLRKQIDELKRKAEQGSQQIQGEVLELALEDLLQSSFSTDVIDPVPKGVHGGDVVQHIFDAAGVDAGCILWESKRTKNWSHGWLDKVRNDQRAAGASCAIIVTEALPEGVRTFGLVEGVWVCSWSCVSGVATALRAGLLEVGKAKLAGLNQQSTMELVYDYLASSEFRHRIEAIVEAFSTMQSDLEAEQRAVQRLWKKRSKQLERALLGTAGLYGDLQGIIGASLPTVKGLEMPCLEEHSTVPVAQRA